jgi:outer membrane immunogenic protein
MPRSVLAGLLLAVLSVVSAGAQDTTSAPVPAPASLWTGFYLGGEAGAGWASSTWTMNRNYYNTLGPTLLGNEVDMVASSFMVGGFAGYAWQVGPVTVGPELGVRSGGFVQQQPDPFFPATDDVRSNINWMTSATLRVGTGQDRWQVFARGGWAGADIGFAIYDRGVNVPAMVDTWVNGWTVGVGAEYRVLDRVSLGVTWDYTQFGASSLGMNCSGCGGGAPTRGSPILTSTIRLNAVMARLAYHFAP